MKLKMNSAQKFWKVWKIDDKIEEMEKFYLYVEINFGEVSPKFYGDFLSIFF